MSTVAKFGALTAKGLLRFGARSVSAADLLADGGLLKVSLADAVPGAWVEIEAGATLRGIQVLESDGSILDLAATTDYVTLLTLVVSPSVPYVVTAKHEDLSVAADHRLRVPVLAVPGTYADGFLTEHQLFVPYDPILRRWRVSYSA